MTDVSGLPGGARGRAFAPAVLASSTVHSGTRLLRLYWLGRLWVGGIWSRYAEVGLAGTACRVRGSWRTRVGRARIRGGSSDSQPGSWMRSPPVDIPRQWRMPGAWASSRETRRIAADTQASQPSVQVEGEAGVIRLDLLFDGGSASLRVPAVSSGRVSAGIRLGKRCGRLGQGLVKAVGGGQADWPRRVRPQSPGPVCGSGPWRRRDGVVPHRA